MNIAIAGAGAMGCRFGSMLHRSGHEVCLIDDWTEHVESIRKYGLKIIENNREILQHIPAMHYEDSKEPCDLLIILTKTTQTENIIKRCMHLIKKETYVLTLQNGIGNLEILKKYFLENQILIGVTTFSSSLINPGKILFYGSGDTKIMKVNKHITNKLKKIMKILKEAEMRPEISSDVQVAIWEKAAFNSVLNPLCTLIDASVYTIGNYGEEDVGEVINGILDEVVTVAKIENINLQKENVINMIEKAFKPSMSGHHYPSMVQDIKSKRKTEIDYLNGAIVEKGKQYKVNVPYNKLITYLIHMLEKTA